MSKIATIRTFVGPKLDENPLLRQKQFEQAHTRIIKTGWSVHRDGRLYVPEANRGRGVGYGRHGRG